MAAAAAATQRPDDYAGVYHLEEIIDETGTPLPLPQGFGPFELSLSPIKRGPPNPNLLRLSVKVSNAMGATVEFLGCGGDAESCRSIRVGPVMSTRMMPRDKERQALERYLGTYLEQMATIDLTGGGDGESENENGLLVLASPEAAGKARIVCRVLDESKAR